MEYYRLRDLTMRGLANVWIIPARNLDWNIRDHDSDFKQTKLYRAVCIDTQTAAQSQNNRYFFELLEVDFHVTVRQSFAKKFCETHGVTAHIPVEDFPSVKRIIKKKPTCGAAGCKLPCVSAENWTPCPIFCPPTYLQYLLFSTYSLANLHGQG